MGMFDSFEDASAKCPKCHAKVNEWQTKNLESLGERWKKGDFLQYRKWEALPESRRKRKPREIGFGPLFRTTSKFVSDAPLFFNAKIPVHYDCSNCNAWLEGYAKIVGGRFAEIVEIEATRKEKLLVVISPDAKTLRQEYESRLSHLQESCPHKKTKWIDIDWMLHSGGRQLVCLKCDKILKTKPVFGKIHLGKATQKRLKGRREGAEDWPLQAGY